MFSIVHQISHIRFKVRALFTTKMLSPFHFLLGFCRSRMAVPS